MAFTLHCILLLLHLFIVCFASSSALPTASHLSTSLSLSFSHVLRTGKLSPFLSAPYRFAWRLLSLSHLLVLHSHASLLLVHSVCLCLFAFFCCCCLVSLFKIFTIVVLLTLCFAFKMFHLCLLLLCSLIFNSSFFCSNLISAPWAYLIVLNYGVAFLVFFC